MKISREYADQLNQMHTAEKKKLGHGVEPPQKLVTLIESVGPKTILDFGCGKGNMLRAVQEKFPNTRVYGYDPGTIDYKEFPKETIDLIYSADVLEHIEPEFLDETLLDLFLSAKIHYHNIACFPAKKRLPDGRNCHLIIEEPEWWLNRVKDIIGNKMTIEYTNSYVIEYKNRSNKYFEIVLKANGNS